MARKNSGRIGCKVMASSFLFSENISTIFMIVRDATLLRKFLSSTDGSLVYFVDIKNFSRFFKKDSECLVSMDQDNPVLLKVETIFETDYYCKIVWEARTQFKNIAFKCEFHFHYVDDSTTYFMGLYHIPVRSQKDAELIFSYDESLRKRYYFTINEYLLSKQYNKTHTEILKAKADFKFSVKLITNVKIVSELLGDFVYSSTKQFEKGTKILTMIHLENNSKNEVLINVKEAKKSQKEIFFGMSINHKKKEREVYVTFHMQSENGEDILIIFTTHSYQPFSYKYMELIRSTKVKFLKRICRVMEKHNVRKLIFN